MKSIPISVRLTQDEADFIAHISAPSAVTPSDKLRYIISQARDSAKQPKNLSSARDKAHQTITPLLAPIELAEMQDKNSSTILAAHHYWLERSLATLILFSKKIDNSAESVSDYEEQCILLLKNLIDQMQHSLSSIATSDLATLIETAEIKFNSISSQRSDS
ncbi:hypothetical protein [Amphritea balenae]|uniref:Uncharacterized protein n=1 Tax=Amphritea balenae TaxID=452629 RepID=A0A3P1SNV6_9GAMM|nr:hypothetical protein [Amphritea balenae]RRC98823.1 hypothetical protein EHS89_11580 [Amphritea balenae]GGK62077.1 hypothetical protein GCM10007941_10210 [Amphritea balenae]